MMTDLSIIHYGAMALVVTGWIGMIAWAGLKGWNGWLALKRAELELLSGRAPSAEPPAPYATATRIDVADLKERVRKLEAIAAGIDL
jgi:hypothetical protein